MRSVSVNARRRDADGVERDPGSPTIPPALSLDLLQAELEKVLASPMFDASERNRRFLRYIVEETLAGRADRIKGYSVGISVFDRDAGFDPQIDPVVRIEAGRLRRSLERYYLTDGRATSTRISVPKGGYVPRFEVTKDDETRLASRGSTVPSQVPPAAPSSRSLFVLPFVPLSGGEAAYSFAAGLTEEIVVEFAKQPELSVFAVPSAESARAEVPKDIPVRLLLCGTVRLLSQHLRVAAHVIDRVDNRHLWSVCVDRVLKRLSLLQAERDVGRKIAVALFKQRGRGDLAVTQTTTREREIASFRSDATEPLDAGFGVNFRRPKVRQKAG